MRMDRARNSRGGNIDPRHHDSGRSASRCGRAWGCGERAVRRGGDHAARIRHKLAADGQAPPASARYQADTIDVGPGQRYDVIRTARKPGKWLVQCHIPRHTADNNIEQKGGGGLMLVLDVQ
jgi:hypothetical protein